MKKIVQVLVVIMFSVASYAQNSDSLDNQYTNSADNLLLQNSRLLIGGYGEVHYNQPLNGSTLSNGLLDVHRVIMLIGYNFSDKIQFVSELEFEHVQEVYVEQAFLQYKLNNYFNFRAGLMLVPMGIINEYHEPTTFNGVERPLVDQYIAPTTWREIGVGFTGNIMPAFLKYQFYVMNGFNGYNGSAKINGRNGLRSGRQKGAESYISSPNFSGKLEYFGLRGLNVGLSGYFGETQSTLYDGIEKTDEAAMARADSSVVGVAMLGLDARYTLKGLQLRGQLYYAGLSNAHQYNVFTAAANQTLNDVGSAMIGYYAEAGYNVLRSFNTEKALIPFARYEFLNTHHRVDQGIDINPTYRKNIITTGLTFKLTSGAVVKADMQFIKSGDDNRYAKTFNAGIGVMF